MRLLGASLMCADFLQLGGQISELEKGGIDFYHIDIMDGQFVDNFALSIDFIGEPAEFGKNRTLRFSGHP
ncbi:TPA: hypothetical protein ACYUPC_004468 [Escherichia coli]